MSTSASSPRTPVVSSVFTTSSRDEYQKHVEESFGPNELRVLAPTRSLHVRHVRHDIGAVQFDGLDSRLSKIQRFAPLRRIYINTVRSGTAHLRRERGSDNAYEAGMTFVTADARERFVSQWSDIQVETVGLDVAYLREIAGCGDRPAGPTICTSYEPIDAQRLLHWNRTVAYARDSILDDPESSSAGLVVVSAAHALAAAALTTFPTTLVAERRPSDTHDGKPASLRRAISYIEDHLGEDITLVDLSRHARVSARAVQLSFRRYEDCTPLEYIRRARLAAAREALLNADIGDVTVSSVAHAWGFGNASRFAAYYRRVYGESPQLTLQR